MHFNDGLVNYELSQLNKSIMYNMKVENEKCYIFKINIMYSL